MWNLIFGGILVFAGFYLIVKGIYARVKGERITLLVQFLYFCISDKSSTKG